MNAIFADCKNKDVIIATDPDREGYGIAYLFYEVIKTLLKVLKEQNFTKLQKVGSIKA